MQEFKDIVKNEQIFQQVINEIYEGLEDEACFDIRRIEEVVVKNLLGCYSIGKVAKFTGLSVRTITNKKRKVEQSEI